MPRQPLRRYGKGGRAPQSSNRSPPEYVRGIEDIGPGETADNQLSAHEGSDAASEASTASDHSLYDTDYRPSPQQMTGDPEAETGMGGGAAGRSVRHEDLERSDRKASNRHQKRSKGKHSRRLLRPLHIDLAYPSPGLPTESQREPWKDRCPGCTAQFNREALLWGWIDDLNARLQDIEKEFGKLVDVSGGLIEYLKESHPLQHEAQN